MEEDDEFGDLYTDVLTASYQSQQQPPAPQQEADPKAAGPTTRPIDLNINSDDEEILYGAPNSNFTNTTQEKTLASDIQSGSKQPELNLNFNLKAVKIEGLSEINEPDSKARVLVKSEDVELPNRGFQDSNFMDEANIDFVVEERDDKDDVLMEKDQIKGENADGNLKDGNFETEVLGAEEPMIPGVSIPGVSGGNGGDGNIDNDWDSDSEDDLQIVLNDSTHGPMGMEGMGIGEDEDDEDGEPLVIVADNDGLPNHPPMMDEQEWGGEEGGPTAANGERKDIADALKVNGGVPGVAAKVGYNNHAYHHPYHSQYKYVRPGAAPMPGAPPVGPGGTPGQVRPPVSVGPVAGRGRGDWRPAGMKGGYGMSGWGGSGPERGFGIGLEFTLPSHKTIFEVDIDGFEEKPWRLPGIDVTDFFNFGLNEESWKDYCKQLEQLRLESTMQGKIRVYESGRTEQEYDPDLPPELAAAAGIQDISSENVNNGKTDATSNDIARGSVRMRPPLPTGRPIQVETGSGDRLPSVDTRPPRQRDSDAIIEIVCQDSADDDQCTRNDKDEVELSNNPSAEDFRGDARGGPMQEHVQDSDGFQHSYKSHKREPNARRPQFMNPVGDHLTKGDGVVPFSSGASDQFVSDSGGPTSAHGSKNCAVQHEERGKEGSACDRSPDITPSDSRERLQVDNEKDESFESVDGRHSPVPLSPTTDQLAQERDMENKDDIPVGADTNREVEREEMALDARTDSEPMNDEFVHSTKKQKLNSRHEQSSPQETDGGEDSRAGRSSDNSKVQSGSSRDYRKLRDAVEEEVVQDGRFMRMGNAKKAVARDEDRVRKKARNEKEAEKHRVVVKGREDSYPRKGIESSSAHYIDRQREREYSEGVWQRRDEDLHGRRTKVEEPRKRELADEMGSRHRSKVREFDGSDREEQRHLYRKQLENVALRPDYEKDMGARHRDRDELKRYDTLDDRHNKRRKEETKLSREQHADKEDTFHSHGENMVRRKRERDDTLDHRKRDELMRLRDDEQQLYIRHKEDGVFQRERSDRQREREEWFRLKQSHEEALSKRDREEVRGGVRAGRVAEEKAWASHSRGKDEYRNSDQHSKEVRHADHTRRRDRVENESPSRLRIREDERRARHDRMSAREDRAPPASDNSRANEKRHKDFSKKGKDFEGDYNSQVASNMNEDGLHGQRNESVNLKGKFEQGSNENKIHRNRQTSRKHQEEASSDEEQQDSRRGRSKLERWASHKEKEFSMNAKSSSLNMKDMDVHKSSGASLSRNPNEALKIVENTHQPAASNKNGGGDPESNNVATKHMEDKHLETVEKLKKRSERFKLPMPSEKEAPASKKVEGDTLSSAQSEIRPDAEVKPERPARRRRWTSN